MPTETISPPFRHVDPTQTAEAYQFDDMSSIHQSIIDVDDEQRSGHTRSHISHVGNNLAVRANSQYGGISHQQEVRHRRNAFMIVTLLLFVGIVAAIAVAVVLAMQDKPIGAESMETDQVVADNEVNVTAYDRGEEVLVVEIDESKSDNITLDIFYTITSSTEVNSELEHSLEYEEMAIEIESPTYRPTQSSTTCIPLELGIIFDGNANQTAWKIVEGADGSTDNEVVWQSTPYDAATYDSKAVTHRKCLPPQMYTFVFTDANGARSYVLSSDGVVIVTGKSIDSKEDIVAFELPFENPEPIDVDGDGVEDRLGTLMPYDSSGLQEGVDCEPFRLEIQTDNSGVETLWRLYEGPDNSGDSVVDGGPYASNSNYVFEYCLKSSSLFTFYIYDWASDGLCCVSGEGYYKISSGEYTIVDATGEFGSSDTVTFILPSSAYANKLDALVVPSFQPSSTPSTTPSITQKKLANDKPPKNEFRASTIKPT